MGVPSRITISHGLSSVIEKFLFAIWRYWFIFIHVVDAFFCLFPCKAVDALLISK
jgi:hypothetical protein